MRARELADHLLDREGRLQLKACQSLFREFEKKRYPQASQGEQERVIQDHLFCSLKFLINDKGAIPFINRFNLPISSEYVTELVLETCGAKGEVTGRHLRMSVLIALFTPLRQSVGSCFASAPAICVQREEPMQLLFDLKELMEALRLKRTIQGQEIIAPIALSPGPSKEPQCVLLKVWEYTLATFSDYKIDFFEWNLAATLGLDSEERGGIGEIVYGALSEKLERENVRTDELQAELEAARSQLQMAERRLKNADSYDKVRRLKAELQSHTNTFYAIQDQRERSSQNAHNTSEFYRYYVARVRTFFASYFQEVYDPNMFADTDLPFDDSPAGFRLVYKHGRIDPASWTLIHNQEEYTEALVNFFLSIETPLIADCDWEEGKLFIQSMTGQLITHLRSDTFIKSGRARLEAFHKKSLRSQGVREPWSYIAGGSMATLVKGYFGREGDLKEESREIESPLDLLIFFLDKMKALPWRIAKRFVDEPHRALLANSPTHAFSILPGLDLFKEGWLDDGFTYTFVRDEVIGKGEKIYRSLIEESEQQVVARALFNGPVNLQPGRKTIKAFRDELIQLAPLERVDHILRLSLPFTPARKAEEIVGQGIKFKGPVPFFSLFNHLRALSKENRDYEIRKELEEMGVAPSPAVVFADTNWAHFFFSFAYNPGTETLELWRTDRSGLYGFPMARWSEYLSNGAQWTLYLDPIDRQKWSSEFLPNRV